MIGVVILLASWLSIMLIVFLLIPLYKKYRIDAFRYRMFCLRGELFDEARKGTITFESDSYIMLRQSINTYIRFAHQLNLTKIFLFSWALKRVNPSNEPFLEKLKRKSTKEQKKIVVYYYERLTDEVMRHLILSPFFFIFVLPIILLTFCILVIPLVFVGLVLKIRKWQVKSKIRKLQERLKIPLDNLDLEQVEKISIMS